MKRYRPDHPADICFARGTFNSHPYVMGAMTEFLHRLDSEEIRALYQHLDQTWNDRAEQLNGWLRQEDLPVKIANLSSIWTISYTRPSRYNWMLQYYLRAEGLALSWVGTGRLIFSLNYTDADFAAVVDRFRAACRAMQSDGGGGPTNELPTDRSNAVSLWEMFTLRRSRILPRGRLFPPRLDLSILTCSLCIDTHGNRVSPATRCRASR